MLLTVVPNPALDKTIVLPDFVVGQIHRAQEVLILAGGKGFNFARALQTLGEQAQVIAPIGGYAGQQLLALAAQEGLMVNAQKIQAEVRTCLTVIDPAAHYRATEIYEQGSVVTEGEWDALLQCVSGSLAQASFLVICGSFPPGVPADGLARLLKLANAAGTPVLLDTYGPFVTDVLPMRPALLKINQVEAGKLVGRNITTPSQALEAAKDLQQCGAREVVISLGKVGVVGCAEDGQPFGWSAPVVSAICATGSGDSMLAGIAAGLVRRQELVEAVRLGVATGAANTLQIGAGRLALQQVEELLPAVQALSIV